MLDFEEASDGLYQSRLRCSSSSRLSGDGEDRTGSQGKGSGGPLWGSWLGAQGRGPSGQGPRMMEKVVL